MKQTIAQQALELLSPIPEDQWMANMFSDGKSRCCAIGHFTRLTSEDPNDYSVNNCRDTNYSENLRNVSRRFMENTHDIYIDALPVLITIISTMDTQNQ